jgi:O-acetylserine/cysteine efflux transporter
VAAARLAHLRRFGVAAVILLAVTRSKIRAVCSPALLASGAIGYGGSVVLQNSGIARTSVSQAALLIGAVPVLVAIMAAWRNHAVARPMAWAGFAVSLAGVAMVAGGGGGGATVSGDGLILASLLVSAGFTVAQGSLLRGRDPVAVTGVQFLGAALAVLPVALSEGIPAAPGSTGTALAVIGLAVVGTLAPFTLFAYGQSKVAAEVAGAFVNLEPVVGAAAGAVVFGDPASLGLIAGGAAILVGIAMSSRQLFRLRPDGGACPGRPARGEPPAGRSSMIYELEEVCGPAGKATARSASFSRTASSADSEARKRRSASAPARDAWRSAVRP